MMEKSIFKSKIISYAWVETGKHKGALRIEFEDEKFFYTAKYQGLAGFFKQIGMKIPRADFIPEFLETLLDKAIKEEKQFLLKERKIEKDGVFYSVINFVYWI